MSRYRKFQVERLQTTSLFERKSKVDVSDFWSPPSGSGIADFFGSLPRILAVRDLHALAARLISARECGRAMIWGFGGHVIKVGLGPLLIDLMDRGYVTALATNGSGMIHDFEIALSGATSEEVSTALKAGEFGMARETGQLLNRAILEGVKQGCGIGESVGFFLDSSGEPRFPEQSVFLQAFRRSRPVTVHVALGTDTIHAFPEASGAAIGEASLTDFKILAEQVSRLEGGGVYLNLGSAVVLPEVFLKAVSLVRNTGNRLERFTTANLDFIQHYRPLQNVVIRPVAETGEGFSLTGHHEIMLPLLAALLTVMENGTARSTERSPAGDLANE